MTLTDSLNQILEWHRKNNTPAARLLQPGLSEDEILGTLQGVPFKVSREFIELYRWRNGTAIGEEGEDTSLFEIHRFLPLEEAVDNFQASYPAAKDSYELSDWVQVFQDVTSDGYGVTGGAQLLDHTPVVLLMEGEVQEVFSSLAKMMETVAAAFQQGAMGWEDEEMETDFFAWGELAKRLNPEIKYWQDYLLGGE
jgi:hypothetical protein